MGALHASPPPPAENFGMNSHPKEATLCLQWDWGWNAYSSLSSPSWPGRDIWRWLEQLLHNILSSLMPLRQLSSQGALRPFPCDGPIAGPSSQHRRRRPAPVLFCSPGPCRAALSYGEQDRNPHALRELTCRGPEVEAWLPWLRNKGAMWLEGSE